MAHHLPLLDAQYNPTETLYSFSNAVFNYLDMYYEPKRTQLLESEKSKALLSFLTPENLVALSLQTSSLVLHTTYLAYGIETVFTAHGASLTRNGLVAFLRSEILSDPNEAFAGFEKANQAMRLRPPFVRSQFPPVAEPRAKELMSFIEASISKCVQDMGWSSAAGQEEQLNALKVRYALEQRGQQAAIDLVSSGVCYYCRKYSCNCRGII
ncbi:hypothetical protein BGZ92_006836 [Podila epicladia]|nr:hypothetical protein BGZ92_006836 [Podila epicladia]